MKFPWDQWACRLQELAKQGVNSVVVADTLKAESGVSITPAAVRHKAESLGIRFIREDKGNPAKDALVAQLWGQGLTALQIATEVRKQLGISLSRNAVLGIRYRLDLPAREPQSPQETKPEKPKRKKPTGLLNGVKPPPAAALPRISGKFSAVEHKQARTPLPPERLEDHEIPLSQRCSVLDLTMKKCRWPVGDVKTPWFFFCGAETSQREWRPSKCPYCDVHADRALGKRAA